MTDDPLVNIEAERALIGKFMLDADYYLKARDELDPMDFSDVGLRRAYVAMESIYLRDGKIEILALIDAIKDDPQAATFSTLNDCASEAELFRANDWPRRTVLELSRKRRLRDGLRRIANELNSGNADVHQDLISLVFDTHKHSGRVLSAQTLADEGFETYEKWRTSGRTLEGPRTGFPTLDEHLGGLVPGRVTLLYGPTGRGKTQIVLNWLARLIQDNVPCLFVTLEMRPQDILNRLLAILSGLSMSEICAGRLNDIATKWLTWIRSSRLWTADNMPRTAADVALVIEKHALLEGVQVAFVDHIGEIAWDNPKRREDRDERFGRWLEIIRAPLVRHGVHGVIVAQANRQEEIGESLKLAQKADAALALRMTEEGPALDAVKNRFGPAGVRYALWMNGATQRVRELPQITGANGLVGHNKSSRVYEEA